MKSTFLFVSLAFIVLYSCKGERQLSDTEKMQESVRSYYFLEDSAKVKVAITDTLYLPSVFEMMGNVRKNIGLVQMDIDTLKIMIDDRSYRQLESIESENGSADRQQAKVELLQMELKLRGLEFKKQQFIHTQRVLNHLRRKAWADVAGFNVQVSYQMDGEMTDAEVMMDGEFEVVD